MLNSTRFDLEQQIMNVWAMKEDIDLLCENVIEQNLTTDQTVNILMGMSTMFDIKMRKTFETLEKLLKEMK